MLDEEARPMSQKQHHGRHFTKFTDAVCSLVDLATSETLHNPGLSSCALIISHLIGEAQRFYLPADVDIIGERELTAEVKTRIHLPFPETAVLSEAAFNNSQSVGWTISAAIEPSSSYWPILFPAATCLTGFGIVSASLNPALHKQWVPSPFRMTLEPRYNESGFSGVAGRFAWSARMNIDPNIDAAAELNDDFCSIANLCMMLSAQNVRRTERAPASALQLARTRRGRQPLLSYHVLTVDGEHWDNPTSPGDGPDRRSHFRRGHLRRLDSGARLVWVRSTIVHGSKPGFVAKDYLVSPPAPAPD